MIHYHGTPIGGTRQDVARFLVGRHALVPFRRQDDIGPVIENCQSFVLDNSAFSYWKNGETLDVNKYAIWVESLARIPNLDWCLIPDVIDGDEETNRRMILDWLERGIKIKSVPVWHLHESFDYLLWMMSIFDTVALGSSGKWATPNSISWWERMNEVMSMICNHHGQPLVKLHGLRMLNPKIFTRIPFASADSTNAAVNCGSLDRFGIYKPATAAQRAAVIADRIESNNAAVVWRYTHAGT